MKKMIAAFKRFKDACIAYLCSHIFNADTSNDETCSATRYKQQEGQIGFTIAAIFNAAHEKDSDK